MTEPTFSDRQVRAILKRAVEQAPAGRAAGKGVTLSELRAIAGEVGIEPGRLDAAVREITGPGLPRANPLIGAPLNLSVERTVPGVVQRERMPELVALIRRGMGRHGEVNEVGGSLEWSASGELGSRHVVVAPREDGTALAASADLKNAAVNLYVPWGIIGGVVSIIGFGVSAEESFAAGIVLSILLLPTLYLVLRTIFKTITGREAEKLQRVVDELASAVEHASDTE